jgi:hypothetical protein
MTWNCSNLLRGAKELALVNLLVSNRVDVMVLTETELPPLVALSFAVDGYTSYLSPPSAYLDKHRVIILVRSTLATATKS